MDKVDLLPGQNWKIHITKAIKESKYFIALLSSNSLSKKGYVQKELKLALDILGEFPPEDIFVIPARLDDCLPQDEVLKYLHWADLFPAFENGLNEILRVLVPESEIPDTFTGSSKNKVSEPKIVKDSKISVSDVKEKNTVQPEDSSASETDLESVTNIIGMKFVFIPPGTFMMGSPESEKDRDGDETLHEVILTKGFYMQTTQGNTEAVEGIDG